MLISPAELESLVTTCITESTDGIVIDDEDLLKESVIDAILATILFSTDEQAQIRATTLLKGIAKTVGVISSPTTALYQAIQKGEVSGFTVPAINLRIMPYEVACSIFHLMEKHEIGIVIFELARSEMEYTKETPSDLAMVVLAAAIKSGYRGHVFIQGDHYQVSQEAYQTDEVGELNRLKTLIIDSIKSGIYNIDIDASTLVDLKQASILKQQEKNSIVTSELTNFIRMHQPEGVEIMIGGEIGHIGDKNSTKEDMDAFMQQYLPKLYGNGIGKLSIQTGTQHGGTVDAAGTVQEMKVDMNLINELGAYAKQTYALAGVVQHGASTLQKDLFAQFPTVHTVEIHLSTGIQNIVFDHLPETVKNTIYSWLTLNCDKDRKAEWTDEQFFYRTRKKAIGTFAQQLWELPSEEKAPILTAVSAYLEELFLALGMKQTKAVIRTLYA